MGLLKESGNKIFFDEEVLLDFVNPIVNYSRLPLFQSDAREKSLYWTLAYLIKCFDDKERFGKQIVYSSYYELIYYLISRYMLGISGTRTTKTVELGGDNWVLGYHLCTLLEAFHEENEYHLVTDIKDSCYNDILKEQISEEKTMENVKLFFENYGELSLSEKSYDLVILNGSTVSLEPEKMVSDAVKLVKENGLILVFNQLDNVVFDDIYEIKNSGKLHLINSYVFKDDMAEVMILEQ